MTQVQHRPHRRGDNIPTVADYAHHNEDAQAIWWLENRYDMEHADEEMDDDPFDGMRDEEDEEEDGVECTGDSRTCPLFPHTDDIDGLCFEER